MGLIDHAEVVLRQRMAAFAERGFTLIPDALSAAELSSLNRAIDDDRARHYDQWLKRGARESGRTQSVDLLTATPDFDAVCAHPAVLPTVRQLLGEDVRLAHDTPPSPESVAHASAHPLANAAGIPLGVLRGILCDGTRASARGPSTRPRLAPQGLAPRWWAPCALRSTAAVESTGALLSFRCRRDHALLLNCTRECVGEAGVAG